MIEINNISVNYRSGERRIPALSSVSLKIEKGDYFSVLGPNGSGKSTLLKALCGLVAFDDGGVKIDGMEISAGQFSSKLFGKVGVVFQEPTGQFLMPSVRREIEAVLENLGLSYDLQQRKFDEIVSEFELRELLNISPQNLSPGQMQIVNLAVAFITGAEILLLDEPTTFLDLKYRRLILDYIRKINDAGRTVIHITQYPDEALQSKNTCIMDSGQIIVLGDSRRILSDENQLKKCGLSLPRGIEFQGKFGFESDDREKSDQFISGLKKIGLAKTIATVESKIIISAENLSYSYHETGFSLNIEKMHLYRDQVVALVGPSGSGKSTLALLLAGIITPFKGDIKYSEEIPGEFGSGKLIGLSWQMPDPVLIGPTVGDDLRLACKNLGKDEILPESLLEKTGLRRLENRVVDTLSGGEKRKLSLASVLAAEPRYIILDEPAAFLDPVSQEELKKLIAEISSSVNGILVIGHDLVFLSELVDRVIGMKDGAITFDLPAGEFFSDPRYSLETGLAADPMISFRKRLVESGIELPIASLKPAAIKRYLENSAFRSENFS